MILLLIGCTVFPYNLYLSYYSFHFLCDAVQYFFDIYPLVRNLNSLNHAVYDHNTCAGFQVLGAATVNPHLEIPSTLEQTMALMASFVC